MQSQRHFIKFVLILAAVVLTVFFLEFVGEWLLLGRPGLDTLSLTAPGAAKPADFLSPTARAYNNILAMVLATVALAIPLTANMYTAKLIDMFLSDRVNQFMLFFWAILAGHVIWVLYLAGPGFTPVWMIRLAVFGAILGWIALVPYFYYIVRFLDPTHILARINEEATHAIEQAEAGAIDAPTAQGILNKRLQEIGTIILKTIDRGERSVTLEGLQCLEKILEYYSPRKSRMSASWFRVDHKPFVGVSDEALEILHEDKTWVEHRVLSHVFLAYQGALAKTQDVISSVCETSRVTALLADRRGDEKALELSVKFFNNYLREAIKRKDLHAVYDLVFQYRLLANELWHRPTLLKKIGGYLQIYSRLAEASGLGFVPQMVAVDLSWIVRLAYEHDCTVARELLVKLTEFQHGADRQQIVKAKVILGGYFTGKNRVAEATILRDNLADVPKDVLAELAVNLLTMEDRSFWEVTDRQVMFEWVPPAERPALKAFLESCQS